MGYIAIVYSGESNVKYLIVENDDQELVKGNLTNLTYDTYIANLYAIDQTGLPMRQAANFPQTVSVETLTTGMITSEYKHK